MRINRLMLHDFKSFRTAELDLGSVTLLVGANASGKSNVRDAFRFLHGVGLGYSLAEVIGEKYGPGGLLVWQGIRGGGREIARVGTGGFILKADGQHDEALYTYQIEVETPPGGAGPRLVQDQPQLAVENETRWQAGNTQVRTLPNDPDIKVWRQALQSFRFLDLHPEAMRLASQPGQYVLNPRGENLSSVVEMLCREPTRKESLLSWIRALTPMDASDLTFKHDHSGRVLMYLVERSGTEISAASASDGTLRFLAMAAALLGKDNGRLFFLEEFDNGIHPTRLHLLLQLFEQAACQSGIQVVATTHNPALLTFLSSDQRSHAALILREGDESRIVRLRDLPDISRVLESEDLGHLLASGWLDDAAALDPELPR